MRKRITRVTLVPLLCAAACVCACSRRTSDPSPAPPQDGASYHAALVDSFASHAFSPNGSPGDVQLLKTKKYLFIYFASHQSDAAKNFTARLIEFYDDTCKKGDNDIGIIFVPTDKSQRDMNSLMQDSGMPWPGLRVNTSASIDLRRRYAGPDVPCLVLLDENDKLLSSSYDEAGKYLSTRAIAAYQKLKQTEQKKTKTKKTPASPRPPD